MKRILYTITLSNMGGAQNHVLDLIEAYRKEHDVALAVGDFDGYLIEKVRALGVPVYVLPTLGRKIDPLQDLGVLRELRAIIKEFKPDVIHAHSTKAGLLTRIAGKLERTPVIFTAHGWVFAPGVPLATRFLVWLIEALAAPLSSRIICVSNYDRDLALKALPIGEKRLKVVHNGIASQMSQAQALPGKNDDRPIIMMVARFQQQKDQPTLIRALAKLPHRKFRLVLLGDGPLLEANKRLVEELGLSQEVTFLGNRTDAVALLSQAHIFALFSHYEGFPISIMEAMRAGLPVVATDVCGVAEEVEHGATGFLVPKGDSDVAAQRIEQLLSNAKLRESMGARARQKFLNEFTSSSMLSGVEQVYAELEHKAPEPISAVT